MRDMEADWERWHSVERIAVLITLAMSAMIPEVAEMASLSLRHLDDVFAEDLTPMTAHDCVALLLCQGRQQVSQPLSHPHSDWPRPTLRAG